MSSSSRVGRIAAAVGIVMLGLAGCGLQPSARLSHPVGPALSQALRSDYTVTAPTAEAPVAAAPAAVDAPTLGVITVYAVDLHFVPKIAAVDRPGRYTVRLINTDELPHDITLPGGIRIAAAPGETTEGQYVVGEAGASFICAVPGHREAGMVGQISVESPVARSSVAP